MSRADAFVLLDDVQFTQGANKHNWTTRVRIAGANGAHWLTMPVRRAGAGPQRILDLRSDDKDARWLPKMLRTLEDSYRKAPHSDAVMPPLTAILRQHNGSVCETNLALIESIAAMLGITTRRLRASEIAVDGAANERLINLTRMAGGNTYLSGDGADDYQVEAQFRAAGIGLQKLGFRHPEYAQRPGHAFTPGLSVVDALCHAGVDATRTMLRPTSEGGNRA